MHTIHTCTCISIHTMAPCMHACIQASVQACSVCTCMHTYMHIYIHTYIHTYKHTYIHVCMYVCMRVCIKTQDSESRGQEVAAVKKNQRPLSQLFTIPLSLFCLEIIRLSVSKVWVMCDKSFTKCAQ